MTWNAMMWQKKIQNERVKERKQISGEGSRKNGNRLNEKNEEKDASLTKFRFRKRTWKSFDVTQEHTWATRTKTKKIVAMLSCIAMQWNVTQKSHLSYIHLSKKYLVAKLLFSHQVRKRECIMKMMQWTCALVVHVLLFGLHRFKRISGEF